MIFSYRETSSIECGVTITFSSHSAEEIEKFKQKDIIEEMMAKLLADYPDVSEVFINERDIYLTHSLQVAAVHPIPAVERGKCKPNRLPCFGMETFLTKMYDLGRTPNRVVGIVGIGHCPGIVRLWGSVRDSAIPPLLM